MWCWLGAVPGQSLGAHPRGPIKSSSLSSDVGPPPLSPGSKTPTEIQLIYLYLHSRLIKVVEILLLSEFQHH